METAQDQEIIKLQERLLQKREAMKPHIQLMSSVESEFKIPKCRHGITYGAGCIDCKQEEHDKEEQIEKEKQTREDQIKKEKEVELRVEMSYRKDHPEEYLKQYGVSPKYMSSSYDNFIGGLGAIKACNDFPGRDIVLIGKTGCGKTHLAVSTLRRMVMNKEIDDARFATVPKLLMEIRDCFKDAAPESERQIVERYISYPVLILDDIGADRATEWAIETLYLIIDGRDSELMPTFITTNLSIPEIEQNYGARIASRISGKNIVNINMPDFRKRR